jgi:hypothetical protein
MLEVMVRTIDAGEAPTISLEAADNFTGVQAWVLSDGERLSKS